MLHQLNMLYREARLARRAFLPLFFEVAAFCVATGLGPRYFVKAGMARGDFPEAQKGQHISKARFSRALDVLNPPLYRKMTQHKLCEKALYGLLGIPSAPLLAYYLENPNRADDRDDQRPLRLGSASALSDFLGQQLSRGLCVKPLEGWGGTGVLVGSADVREEQSVFLPGEGAPALTVDALRSAYRSPDGRCEFIVEEQVQQTGQFAAFNPSSLNTLRVWAVQGESGVVDIIGAYLRVGREGAVVDNASVGGLMCPVALKSGILYAGLSKQSPFREDFVTHPDHAAPLEGVCLDRWQEILDFSRNTLALLPHTRFAGLDIAMTDAGPLLIEANVVPDADGAAHGRIPSKLIELAAGTGRR